MCRDSHFPAVYRMGSERNRFLDQSNAIAYIWPHQRISQKYFPDGFILPDLFFPGE